MDLLNTGARASAQHPEVFTHDPLKGLSGTVITLYAALVETAEAAAAVRGYVVGVTHVTLHCPVDIVAQSLGRHRTTIWRAVKKLRALGLVDARPHKTTAPGISEDSATVNDGELWCVRLNASEGTPARLTYDDLKHNGWRDLARDRRQGRTAHRAVKEHRAKMQQSKDISSKGFDLELLLEWALPSQNLETSLPMTVAANPRAHLEAVLDVQHVAHEDRHKTVDGAAHALARSLGDLGSVMFYRWLLWQLLRLTDAGQAAPWGIVYEQARRARADVQEGFARGSRNNGSGGALFTARLKRSPWWDELTRASGSVGLAPGVRANFGRSKL